MKRAAAYLIPMIAFGGAWCGGYLLGAQPDNRDTRALLAAAMILGLFAMTACWPSPPQTDNRTDAG